MKRVLYNYDIYPKAFLTGVEKIITVKPLGAHAAFAAGTAYTFRVKEFERAEDCRFPDSGADRTAQAYPDEDGCLRLHMTFEREGLYYIQVCRTENGALLADLRVYALNHDMKGRYPLRGDLHLHSCRSDGSEAPAIVVSNYRGHGYDFTVLSDHGRYYPSLEARQLLGIGADDKSALTDLLVVPGEEIHLPDNDVHYINFGGSFSVNALVAPNNNQQRGGDDPAWRSMDGACPDPMTVDEYRAMIRARAASVPRELESERLSFASTEWIYEKVREGGGLGVFVHPYWCCSTMQLSEEYLRFLYEKRPFDAFEVLGGENYYQQNGFQTSFYYEMRAKGMDYPVVGSTDSHGSTEHNRNALICSSIVFAEDNTVPALVRAIKEKYSVAVDTISREFRLVGDFRWVKYGCFLLEEWFPLHDLACSAEGYYLKQYFCGDENAESVLRAMKGQVPRMLKKYFEL